MKNFYLNSVLPTSISLKDIRAIKVATLPRGSGACSESNRLDLSQLIVRQEKEPKWSINEHLLHGVHGVSQKQECNSKQGYFVFACTSSKTPYPLVRSNSFSKWFHCHNKWEGTRSITVSYPCVGQKGWKGIIYPDFSYVSLWYSIFSHLIKDGPKPILCNTAHRYAHSMLSNALATFMALWLYYRYCRGSSNFLTSIFIAVDLQGIKPDLSLCTKSHIWGYNLLPSTFCQYFYVHRE